MTIKVLDLFAGAGGLSLGLDAVRDKKGNPVFELHRAVEIDKYACETLRNHFGSEKVIEGNLTDKSIHEQVVRECKGKISIVAGGIPCQSFSLIGPRSGFGKTMNKFKLDKRDNLYKEFKKIVIETTPDIVLIENVKGILSKKDTKGKKIIDKLINDFEKLGYNFRNNRNGEKLMVLNAADFGVPQFRERVILIGINKNWKKTDVPFIEATHFNPETQDSGELSGLLPYVTLSEAIGDLPALKAKTTYTGLNSQEIERVKSENTALFNGKDEMPFNKKRFAKHLNKISISGRGFFHFIRPNGYKHTNHHLARRQQITDIQLFKAMKEGETAKHFVKREPDLAKKLIKYKMDTFEDKYRRQKWDAPCTTVFAHLEKDGNRFIHPKQSRTITPREAARIQSFPDDFVFCGPYGRKFRQIGNAVPPLMAYNVGLKIYEVMKSK